MATLIYIFFLILESQGLAQEKMPYSINIIDMALFFLAIKYFNYIFSSLPFSPFNLRAILISRKD